MKEVIDKILKEEEAAKKTIEDAEKEAVRIKTEAKTKALNIIEKKQKEVKDFISKRSEEMKKTFLANEKTEIEKIKNNMDEFIKKSEKDIPTIADKILKKIVS